MHIPTATIAKVLGLFFLFFSTYKLVSGNLTRQKQHGSNNQGSPHLAQITNQHDTCEMDPLTPGRSCKDEEGPLHSDSEEESSRLVTDEEIVVTIKPPVESRPLSLSVESFKMLYCTSLGGLGLVAGIVSGLLSGIYGM
jgi:hypothetical protein